MIPRDAPVSKVMTADVISFAPADNVRDAMQTMLDRHIDGAPVVDTEGRVVGVITTSDLIVQETELRFPTVWSIFTGSIEFGSGHFDDDLRRALGATVGEVMNPKPVTAAPGDTIEAAATRMHEHKVSRLPVVDPGGHVVGVIARGDILRALLAEIPRS